MMLYSLFQSVGVAVGSMYYSPFLNHSLAASESILKIKTPNIREIVFFSVLPFPALSIPQP